jgi:hypothetical protein
VRGPPCPLPLLSVGAPVFRGRPAGGGPHRCHNGAFGHEVPENRYFGGNIILGDLLVVQDFIDHIRDYLARGNPRPDLVVIPSTPFGLGAWRRDLTGRPYMDIERATGVPVALLECERIYE